MIYKLTDGIVSCWVKSTDEIMALKLAKEHDDYWIYPDRVKALKLDNDDTFFLDVGYKIIEHTVQDWKGIYQSFPDCVICFSEY